jgi:hypothetical protein
VGSIKWCYNSAACGQACTAVCSAVGLTVIADNTTWFQAQDTAAECQAISNAFGIAQAVTVSSYTYACMEDTWGVHGAGLNGPLLCSTYSGCPAEHRTNMDNLGTACTSTEARRSICPCQ